MIWSPVVCSVTSGLVRLPDVSYFCTCVNAAELALKRLTFRLSRMSLLEPEYQR